MDRSKAFFRGALLLLFDLKKTAAEAHRMLSETYGVQAPSQRSCRFWFERFKSGDFNLQDKERPGQPKKFEDDGLQALLDENPTHTQKELAIELNVSQQTISTRLHAMGKIRKLGKWVPQQLLEHQIKARLTACKKYLDEHKGNNFLYRIVTCDEKWIYFDNLKRKAESGDPSQPSSSQLKRNIQSQRVKLCFWWDQRGVVYYELLNPNGTVTDDRYQRQLDNLVDALIATRPLIAKNVMFHGNNTKPHISYICRNKIDELGWDWLSQPEYSPDIAPCDYHLFRSM